MFHVRISILAENGVVVSLSYALRYTGHSEAALCFDLPIKRDQTLGRKLEGLLKRLEAASTRLNCKTDDKASHCDEEPDAFASEGRRESCARLAAATTDQVADKLLQARKQNDSSGIVGNLTILGSPDAGAYVHNANILDSPLSFLSRRSSQLEFIVPLEPPKLLDETSGSAETRLLVSSLDIGQYLRKTTIYGFSALVCLCLAVTIVIFSWETDSRRRKDLTQERLDLHGALDNVSAVMLDADTPYVRLDSEDHILNGNRKLAAFLGYPETDESAESKLRGTRFEDWLADHQDNGESRRTYHKVQDNRRKGERVEPYRVNFRTAQNQIVSAKIVSSVVPASQPEAGSLPESFGLLVP
jgi:PAS domain-containing protein